MKRIIFLMLLLLVLCNGSALAQKYEYKNDNINAGHIKKIVYLCTVPQSNAQYVQDPYVVQKVDQLVHKKLVENGFVPVPFSKVIADANLANNVNLLELNTKDPKKASTIMAGAMADYDGMLVMNILAYTTGQQYDPGYSYNTSDTTISTVHDSMGMPIATINTPTTVTNTIPPAIINNASVMLDVKLTDIKSNTVVFAYTEDRTKAAGRVFNKNVDPRGIVGRMTNVCVGDMADKIKDDAKKLELKHPVTR